jgi:hypothetical protein
VQQIRAAFKISNLFRKVDAILFHQGEADHSERQRSPTRAENYLTDFLDKNRAMGVNAPIFLSRASYYGQRGADHSLTDYQNQIIAQRDNVITGPNTDTLINDKYHLPDACHFSSEGFDAFSALWVTAIMHAEQPEK